MPRKAIKKSLYQIYHRLPIVQKLEVEAGLVVFLVLLGAWLFHIIEGWRYLDAVYFTSSTITTVWYGDFTPKHDIGKILAICYQLTAIPIFLYTASLLLERRIHLHKD